MTYPWTGGLSFSLLKILDPEYGSPAEFLHACRAPHEPTDAMKLGTLVHWHLLGGSPERTPLVYMESKTTGEGAVKRWKQFQADHAGEEIYGAADWNEAAGIAAAVREAPHNRAVREEWIDGGQYETSLQWEMDGFRMGTRGVDIILPGSRRIADLKKSQTVRKHQLSMQATALRYPEQLVTYEAAVRACMFDPEASAIVAVCASAPYCTVAMRLGAAARLRALSRVAGWLATLRTCLESDTWPGPDGWEIEPPAWETVSGEDGLEGAAG